jgi:hypothetical protein
VLPEYLRHGKDGHEPEVEKTRNVYRLTVKKDPIGIGEERSNWNTADTEDHYMVTHL